MSSNNNTSNFNQAVWLGIGQLCTFAIAFLTAPIMARVCYLQADFICIYESSVPIYDGTPKRVCIFHSSY